MNQKKLILTLDFGKKDVRYLGAELPKGTIGCEALNITEAQLTAMETTVCPLNPALQAIQSRTLDAKMLLPAKASVLKITDLLEEAFPSMAGKTEDFRETVNELFTKANAANAAAYLKAVKKEGTAAFLYPQYEKGRNLLSLIPTVIQLPSSLRVYQSRMLPFAEALQLGDRTAEGYSVSYADYFPEEVVMNPNVPGWEQMMNVTVEYGVNEHSEIVTRMNFLSFVGMFRADLYEGLRVGHAPRRCPICGRWFLTTNARPTKYCNGRLPGDLQKRSCRQVAVELSSESRELATDNPVDNLCKQRVGYVTQQVFRGKMDRELAQTVKDLARSKRDRMKEDSSYSMERYQAEMELDALLAEAQT